MKRFLAILVWTWGCSILFSASANAATFNQIKNAADLQNALNVAQSNGEDDVIKLSGKTITGAFTYVPTENKSLSIVGANYHSTTLSGGGANPVLVIDTTSLSNDAGADVTLKNVTVENGAASDFGGGLGAMTVDADLTVDNCRFRNNTAGLGNSGGAGLLSFASGNVTVTNSLFTDNSARSIGGLRVSSGEGTITVAHNTISGNEATNGDAGGLSVNARDGAALVTANILDGNACSGGGAGATAILNGSGSVTFTDNMFSNNTAGAGQNGFGGGGVALAGNGFGDLIVTNNSFSGNSTQDSGQGAGNGGGIYLRVEVDTANAFLFNNIVFGNSADGNGDDIYADDDGNNTNHDDIGSTVVLSHNDFTDFYSFCQNTPSCAPDVTQTANLSADPLFADAAGGDLHLTQGSPCIDQGDAAAPALPSTDFEGDARIIGAAPDIGGDEFHL